jgi:hypothetical protein
MRKCKRCNVELTAENSTPAVFKSRNCHCKVCWALKGKQFREQHPEQSVLKRIKQNAKKRGLICSLTVSDIPSIPNHCPVFPWIKLVYQVGVKRHKGSPSLDRINNRKGYIKGNVRWISSRANTLKSDASDKELIYLGNDASKRKISL